MSKPKCIATYERSGDRVFVYLPAFDNDSRRFKEYTTLLASSDGVLRKWGRQRGWVIDAGVWSRIQTKLEALYTVVPEVTESIIFEVEDVVQEILEEFKDVK